MSNEIQLIHDDAAETVYAIVRETAATGRWYDNTTHQALETFDDANWATYKITLALVHAGLTSGNAAYQGTFPALAAGFYWLDTYVQAGATAAQTDYRLDCRLVWWTGAGGELSLAGGSADTRQIVGVAAVAGAIPAVAAGAIGGLSLQATTGTVQTDAAAALTAVIGAKGGLPKLDSTNGLVVQGFGSAGVTVGTVTALTNAPPDSAGVTTLLARVGAFTGTTVNTVLGFFRALLRKDAGATLPSDIGGTFDNTTDSNEALRDRGDAAWITAAGFATPTNITAASGISLAASQHVIVDSGTVTTLTGHTPQTGDSFPGVDGMDDTIDARLAAYNTTGVAKEASVGAIQTILAGITSLAAWLRGMFRKDAINAAALGEINAIHDGGAAGTFSATTDSNEAIADKTSGLTAQQTRDAMKLAPSTGTPATGSVDAELDAVKLKTDLIGTNLVTYASWVANGGTRRIFAGEDFLAADGRGLAFTITDYAGPSLASATGSFKIIPSASYDDDVTAAALSVTATISVNGTTVIVSADLTAAQTAALLSAPPGTPMNYVYQYVATLASGSKVMLAAGRLTVSKAIQ